VIEPVGKAMHHGILKPVVVQYGRIDESCQFGLAVDDVLRLAANALPDRVERRQFALRIDLMHRHGRSRFVRWPAFHSMAARQCPDSLVAKSESGRDQTGGQLRPKIKRFSGIHERISWFK
jgi:hypothetical protein